jgi:hypothetical protein
MVIVAAISQVNLLLESKTVREVLYGQAPERHPRTNTLAYFTGASVTKNKHFNELFVLKTFFPVTELHQNKLDRLSPTRFIKVSQGPHCGAPIYWSALAPGHRYQPNLIKLPVLSRTISDEEKKRFMTFSPNRRWRGHRRRHQR